MTGTAAAFCVGGHVRYVNIVCDHPTAGWEVHTITCTEEAGQERLRRLLMPRSMSAIDSTHAGASLSLVAHFFSVDG
jgi:hypothetical protein